MLSNYPPGVTGNEWQISGPDWEHECKQECPTCESEQLGIIQGYRHESWWTCYTCGTWVENEDPRP